MIINRGNRYMAFVDNLGSTEVTRLKEILTDGVRTLEEINTLKEGLKDTLTAIAEEMNIPKKLLTKAVNIAHKGNFKDVEDEMAEIESLLTKTGKK